MLTVVGAASPDEEAEKQLVETRKLLARCYLKLGRSHPDNWDVVYLQVALLRKKTACFPVLVEKKKTILDILHMGGGVRQFREKN
jgi:hypothetical protein